MNELYDTDKVCLFEIFFFENDKMTMILLRNCVPFNKPEA